MKKKPNKQADDGCGFKTKFVLRQIENIAYQRGRKDALEKAVAAIQQIKIPNNSSNALIRAIADAGNYLVHEIQLIILSLKQ